jgi:hypothetical protein
MFPMGRPSAFGQPINRYHSKTVNLGKQNDKKILLNDVARVILIKR